MWFCSTNMRYCLVLILFAISRCESNEIRCQKFTEHLKWLEIYCENSGEISPDNCTSERDAVVSYPENVTDLQISGCNFEMVLDLTEMYAKTIRVLAIPHSGYLNLHWMSLMVPLNQLEILNISHNRLDHMPTDFVPNMPELKELDLSYNRLQKIDENSRLKGATNLLKVILSHNKIAHIDANTFSDSGDLVFVDLRYNRSVFRIFQSHFFACHSNRIDLKK